MLRIVPAAGAARREQLRDLLGVEVFLRGDVRAGAEHREHRQHLVALGEAPHLLDRLRRRIAVVHAEQLDLAAVDAALVVEHLEIGDLGAANRGIGGGRSRVGHGLPELDRRVGRAGVVVSGRRGRSGAQRRKQSNGSTDQLFSRHARHLLPRQDASTRELTGCRRRPPLSSWLSSAASIAMPASATIP